jgi:chromosome segregation ATPase
LQLQQKGLIDEDGLDEVFGGKTNLQQGTHSNNRATTGGRSDMGGGLHYTSRLKSCEMRLKILINELETSREETMRSVQRTESLKSAYSLLKNEERDVEMRMQQLLDEKQLVEHHLEVQMKKLHLAEAAVTSQKDKEKLLESSVLSIETEIEKLRLLAESG